MSLLFGNLPQNINFLLFDLFALVVAWKSYPSNQSARSKKCFQRSFIWTKYQSSISIIIAKEPKFEFWTFWCFSVVFWYSKYYCCLQILQKTSVYCFLTSLHLWLLGKATQATNLQEPQSAFKDLSCKPIIKALSQLKAEIQPLHLVPRVVAFEPNFRLFCALVWCSDTHNVIIVWKSCLKQPFLTFLPFSHVVAGENLPGNQIVRSTRHFQRPSMWMKYQSCISISRWDTTCCWGGCHGAHIFNWLLA